MSFYKIKFLKNKIYKLALAYLVVIAMPAHAGPNGKIGGNGGDPQNISCPQNLFAVGFKVKHDNQVIISIQLMCQGVNRNTGAPTGPIRATSASRFTRPNVGLTEVTRRCSNGEFMTNVLTGFSGKVLLADVVSGLRFDCVRYSSINPNTGTSVRRQGRSRSIGPRLTGSARRAGFYDANLRDIGIKRLAVRRGYALDSLMVYGAKMPWVIPAPRPSFIDGISIGGGSPSSPQQTLPDFFVRLKSDLWRYIGQTNLNGTIYRRVPASFCKSGMRPNGTFSTKNFTLPNIQYEVINIDHSYNDPNNPLTVLEQFIRTDSIPPISQLSSNQRFSSSISRGSIQRCVVSISGCSECSGSTPYQDPTLRIRVDPSNNIRESNEFNNEIRK